MADEIQFVDGLIVKAPREGAPDFVKASISIKVADLMAWLQAKYEHGDEWVNVDVKESKGGKWYAAVNTYKPKEGAPKQQSRSGNDTAAGMDDDIPFSPIRRVI